MKSINLSRTYVHSGKFYGPGKVEVEDDVHTDLKAREAEWSGEKPVKPIPGMVERVKAQLSPPPEEDDEPETDDEDDESETAEDLSSMKMSELRELGRKRKVNEYNHMTKSELIEALKS